MCRSDREQDELEIMKQLEQFDTPTITNAIATYSSDRKNCLGLYHPQEINWYTDQNMKCLYPGYGARCAHVVTVIYGNKDAGYDRLEFLDLLEAIEESPKPVILAMEQYGSDELQSRNALIGGNMMTAFRQLGVTGVLGDGPARDIEEMRSLNVQCLFRGLAAGHATVSIAAINTPVHVSGMDVCPGEIIHMDQNGAVKFPKKYLSQVLEKAKIISGLDRKRQEEMKHTRDPKELAGIMKAIYD